MARSPFEFKSLILCDEIRKEDNQKLIFIGVYQDNVFAYNIPVRLKFSIWIQAETCIQENPVEIDVSLKPLGKGKKQSIFTGPFEVKVHEEKFKKNRARVNLWIEGIMIQVEEESELIISGRLEGERLKVIDSRTILRHPSPPNLSIEQQST